MKPPAFQFYADDFIGGTCDLSAEEVGAYIRLLCYQWNKGAVPIAEPSKLSRIAGCEVSPDVMAKFPDGKNVRLEEVRGIQDEFRASRSLAGREGARIRWHGHGTANGSAIAQPMANGMAKHSSPSPTPSPELKQAGSASPPAARELLFEGLAKAEGSDPKQLTGPATKRVAVALAAILKASPTTTPQEIEARAKRYRKVMPQGCKLTAHALANHWAKCGEVASPVSQIADGPKGWRERLEAECPGNMINVEQRPFSDVPLHIREKIA